MRKLFRLHRVIFALTLILLGGIGVAVWFLYTNILADFSDLQYSWKDTKYRDVRSRIAVVNGIRIILTV